MAALFRDLRVMPAVRRVAAPAPLDEAYQLAGIEVATTDARDEGAFRRQWRDRYSGGPTPLLLVRDDPDRDGCVLVLGPVDGQRAERSVRSGALAELLRQLSSLRRLEAVRRLASELERLDEQGTPGLQLRDLLSEWTVRHRLREDPDRWRMLQQDVEKVAIDRTWRPVLEALGWTVERLEIRGYLLRHDGRPAAVVHPYKDPAEFARLDEQGRPPEGLLLNDVRREGVSFGLLASGPRLRLLVEDGEGGAVSRYLDLDASALPPEDEPLLGLLAPRSLAGGAFQQLREEARRFGERLRDDLDVRLRQEVLPVLADGLEAWAREHGLDLEEEATREELRRAALTLVFRVLFLLYAEASRYLPVDHTGYQPNSCVALVEEAWRDHDRLDARSTNLWDRVRLLVKAMRRGESKWDVPAYNGALFAADGFEGAALLERLELPDPVLGALLVGVGRDPSSGRGLDYSTLDIGDMGHLYEGLLSLELSLADRPLAYDASLDRYLPVAEKDAEVAAGALVWQTQEGGRKAGGVYYTRAELVRHLVERAVRPRFREHLDEVRALSETDPSAAAERLLDFAVLDPACGSAHFLVEVTRALADEVVRFLAERPLPAVRAALDRLLAKAGTVSEVEDVTVLRRLVLKRCVFGVDLSVMGTEIARLSLWLATFVPGLSLTYLERNIRRGNALIGVVSLDEIRPSGAGERGFFDDALEEALDQAAAAAREVASSDDRTPDEVRLSKEADARVEAATADLTRLLNLHTADALGLKGARTELEVRGPEILKGADCELDEGAQQLAERHAVLHWPVAFPHLLGRDRPGFDAVIGNPPWEEVTVEKLNVYGLYRPGLQSLDDASREREVDRLEAERPEIARRYEREREQAESLRGYIRREYEGGSGDPDLYKCFSQRYRQLLREGGSLGVVLPRSAFVAKGSEAFRTWLFESTQVDRVDFLLNRRRWMFDTHPQYTVALLSAQRGAADARFEVAGVADSLAAWNEQAAEPGLALAPASLGPGWRLPLVPDQLAADVLAKLSEGAPFPTGGGRWRTVAVREVDETNDRKLWRGAEEGLPLWKGSSFERYGPHGADERPVPDTPALERKREKSRPGSGQLLGDSVSAGDRRTAQRHELGRCRIAFRDVARATDSRTAIACLVPADVVLTNTAPYLAFLGPNNAAAQLTCLGVINSLPFDWLARRFVETHLNFFVLDGLRVPVLTDEDASAIVAAAGRLSCLDERYSAVAAEIDVEVGPLGKDAQDRLEAEIDARVARAWGLDLDDLDVIHRDFTLAAVPRAQRERLRQRLAELLGS